MERRVRHSVSLPKALSQRLRALTAVPGSSASQIVTDALTAYLDRHGAHELDVRFAPRLDQHSRAVARIERRLTLVAEAFGTFVQHQLTLVAHQPPFDPQTAKLGRLRYEAFLDLVGRRIAKNASSNSTELDVPETRGDTNPSPASPHSH